MGELARLTVARETGGRPSKVLDDQVKEIILEAIRNGSFQWVACQAAGVHHRTFSHWMKLAEKGEEPYATFAGEVAQAHAIARAAAEQSVFASNPLAWLRYGPGRERSVTEPGWTETKVLASDQERPVTFTLKIGEHAPTEDEESKESSDERVEQLLERISE